MTRETLERMIAGALEAAYPDLAVFCWQGGEPTLAGIEFFREAFRLMRLHGTAGQPVANSLQTNAVLLDAEWAQLCAEYRVLVGVSLDGPRDLHDHYRRNSGGRGSYDDVMRGIAHLRGAGVEFNILALVTAASAGRAAQIYRFFRDQGLRYLQFIPCVEADEKGQAAGYTISPSAYGDFLCELFDAWRQDGRAAISIRLFDALIERELVGNSGLCVLDGKCGDYLVVEHNGDIYPCDFFVAEEWRLGSLDQSDFASLWGCEGRERFLAVREASAEACAGCEWWSLCRGGCPKDRMLAGGPRARTFVCEAHKKFFAHAMPGITSIAGCLRRELEQENIARRT
jgi:uncharacterized protein